MDFLKSKVFLAWVGINAVFPIAFVLVTNYLRPEIPVQQILAFAAVFLILAGNIYVMIKYPKARLAYGITIVLNLVFLILIGSVSFVTAIPQMPFLFESIFSGDWSS